MAEANNAQTTLNSEETDLIQLLTSPQPTELMAAPLRRGCYADEVMGLLATQEETRYADVEHSDLSACGRREEVQALPWQRGSD
jgi:hypothetical protein